LTGLCHDLGKYAHAFQAKLYAENGFEDENRYVLVLVKDPRWFFASEILDLISEL